MNENACEMCQKLKNARAKRAKAIFFIVKYANLRGSCHCCRLSLLKLPDVAGKSAADELN